MVELVFLHLPKTGGSSILKILNHIYGEDKVQRFKREDCLKLKEGSKNLEEVVKPETRVLHGHFLYEEVKDLVRRDNAKLVTFMRHPVDRVISNYKWWIYTVNQDPDHPERKRKDEPLHQYIKRKETRNKQFRFLAGSELSKYDFIGFMDNFEDDLKALAALMGWSELPLNHCEKDSRKYFGNQNLQIDKLLEKKIRRLNRRDMNLYLKAKNLKREEISG